MNHYFTAEEILRLHFQIIEDFGGLHGVRSEDRLRSVVVAPSQDAFGVEQYPGAYEKAAVQIQNIIGDHAFTDGNKRTGITVGVMFLARNGYRMTATPKQLEDFAVQVAVEHLSVEAIAGWLQNHSVPT